MITPFIGLSTFIHIFLIFSYQVFNLKNSSHFFINKYRSIKTLVGLFIIFGIFSFVFVSAVFMVRASVMEKHSSVNLLSGYVSSLRVSLH